jgi:hypothetical protein
MVVLLMTAASTSSARTREKPPVRCAPRHSHVLVAGSRAEVYERRDPESGALEVFGCAYGHKRRYLLGGPPEFGATGGGGVKHERVAGTVVAYEIIGAAECSEPNREWRVVVRDLRNGRFIHLVPTGTKVPKSLDVGIGPVVSIVVKSDGAVAWIVEDELGPASAPVEYEVHALDKAGSRLLASGTDVGPRSLALRGSMLYWTKGEKPFSASLD